jgi:PIN domain nuclease of toxin-antitoxin system
VILLLDTHTLVWWQAGGDRLSRVARRAIEGAESILVSPLTPWEVATLQRRGRLELDRDPMDWARDLLRTPGISEAPLTPAAATWAGTLQDHFPGDPIDRLLYATARDLRVPFVTKDERLQAYASSARDVDVVW